jgi:hypothetical protein
MILPVLMAAAVGLPPPIRGDFDHDGREDRAGVMRMRSGYGLMVWRGADPRRPVLVDTIGDVVGFYLTKAPRGRFRTACAKGYDLGEAQCRYRSVRVTGDVLDFGTREASEAMAFWNGRRFEVVWMSD